VGEGVVSLFVVGQEEDSALPTSTYFSGPDPLALWSGTSFAAPQVAGRLAQRLSEGLSPADAVVALHAEAAADTGAGPDPQFGHRLRIL
jgi:thermitase